MNLINQEEIDKISGCPSRNFEGSLKLFRWVNSKDFENSFKCYGSTKPKFAKDCIAWGLSTYKSKKSAIEVLKNMSVGMQRKFDAIASGNINNADGIKYQSRENLNHYTFFPVTELTLTSKFNVVDVLEDDK